MAYLLLAVGGLMSAAGIYLVVTGAHIVQVEEGWTSVIAGTTLLVGGIVTAALGLVLRVLLKLQANTTTLSLAAPTAGVGLTSGITPVAVSPARIERDLPSPALAAHSGAEMLETEFFRPDVEAVTGHQREPEHGLMEFGDRDHEAAIDAAADRLVADLAGQTPVRGTPIDRTRDFAVRHDDEKPADVSTEAGRLRDRDGLDRAATSPPAPETPAPPPARELVPEVAAAPPTMVQPTPTNDWLDQAFAELDESAANPPPHAPAVPPGAAVRSRTGFDPMPPVTQRDRAEPATPAPTATPEPAAISLPKTRPLTPEPAWPPPATRTPPSAAAAEKPTHAQDPAYEDSRAQDRDEIHDEDYSREQDQEHGQQDGQHPGLGHASARPAAPVDVHPAPPPAAATSAVIGRYEAEGTSYVMYADGSIEAQSESGVYRFASMAELKAFIES